MLRSNDVLRDERRIECPLCNSLDYECIYIDAFDQPVGCSECVRVVDGDSWEEEQETKAYDSMIDFRIDEAMGK